MRTQLAFVALALGLSGCVTSEPATPPVSQTSTDSGKARSVEISWDVAEDGAVTMTMDVHNSDIRRVLQKIAKLGDAELVMDDGVQGVVSLKVQEVSWFIAMSAVARTLGFKAEREGKIVRVSSSS